MYDDDQRPALIFSEIRHSKDKFTDDEFTQELAAIREHMLRTRQPLKRLDITAVQEKPNRVAAAKEREV